MLKKLFGKKTEKSGKVASSRLKVVITQDRARIGQEVMDDLRRDMIEVFKKYLVIDESGLEFSLATVEQQVGLSISIPVRKVKSKGKMF